MELETINQNYPLVFPVIEPIKPIILFIITKIYIDKNIEQKINEFFEYIKLKNEFDIIIFDDSSIVDYAVLCRKTYIHTLVLITKNNLYYLISNNSHIENIRYLFIYPEIIYYNNINTYICHINSDTKNFYHNFILENNINVKNVLLNEDWINDFYNNYIKSFILRYAGMYGWNFDLPKGSKSIFEKNIEYFNQKQITQPRILEIGSYTGTSIIPLVEKISNSIALCIDRWKPYDEEILLTHMKDYNIEKMFDLNIKNSGFSQRIKSKKGNSRDILLQLVKEGEMFDFIYIDGSHFLLDVFLDLFLAFSILKTGGIMAIDDYPYNYNKENVLLSPFEAVNYFLNEFDGQINVLDMGYRVFIEKK